MRQKYEYFEHKLSLAPSIEEAADCDKITFFLWECLFVLSRFDNIVNSLS
jgi:hypothetical protein